APSNRKRRRPSRRRGTKTTTFPSDRLFALLLCAALTLPIGAQQAAEVFPLAPADDSVVGPREPFRVGYRGIDDSALREARFRIDLHPVAREANTLRYDQRRRKRGWSPGEPGVMLYRPGRPIADGSYEWDVSVWDGVMWRSSGERFRLRIDSVPPSPVENLTVTYDAERGVLRLDWNPVVTDVDGGPEYVARYHVYRHSRADRAPKAEPFEIAEVVDPTVELPVSGPDDARLWFFRVSAEDLAGNETGRPR
ncbi:MAG TPA: hypothetical protein VD788_15805, partial [Candidatus Polarisedimenticolaceae bacterium]|nr:hypothetical protein [Candidatus Polarisedimenticolaceae bacterium]